MTVKVEELPLLRQSERGAFKRCNWAWYQEYVLRHRPIVEHKDAAEFGTLIHLALATYYIPGTKRGPHPADTFMHVAKDKIAAVRTTQYENDELVAKWEDFHDLGVDLMEAYVEHYGGDPHWDVLDAERRFDVVVPDTRYKPLVSEKGRKGFRPIVLLVGTFDLCVRDLNDDEVKMIDHKTCSSFQTHHLTLDEQASTYIAVATTGLRHQGLIGKTESVKGMEYNFIKKSKVYAEPLKSHYIAALTKHTGENFNPTSKILWTKYLKDDLRELADSHGLAVRGEKNDPPFMRHWVPRTAKERQRQIVRISEEAQVMDMVRKGHLPLLKTPQRDCYYCKFFDLCELDESGGDTDYFIETTMKTYDPYSDHRQGADNSKKVETNGGQDQGPRDT
jgi:hypothetical protein